MALGVLHQLAGCVETQRLAVEHGHQELGRVVALDPAAHVDQQRKTRGVAFGKAVAGEALDLLVHALRKPGLVAARGHAVDQAAFVLLQVAAAFPGGHGAAQGVGLAGREARRQHSDLHALLLKDGNAQRAAQRFTQIGAVARAGVAHRYLALPAVQIRMHRAALDRAGTHQRDLDHQVVVTTRFQARQHAHLRAALDLEHAHGIGGADHVVGGFVAFGNVLQGEGAAPFRADECQRLANGGEHAQGQHVDLEQTQRVEVVLVPLDHGAVLHAGVLNGHQARKRQLREHEAAGVLRKMARKAHELRGELQQLAHRQVVGVEPGLQQPPGLDRAPVPPARALGQHLERAVGKTQGLAHVAQRAARAVADHGGGERGAFAAVLVVEVLNDLLAPLVFKVDVDVGWLVALARDEALEQQAGALRVHGGDAQAVAHHAVGRRTPALAQDVFGACERHDVVDGQKVVLVPHVGDQFELVFDLLREPLGRALRPAPGRALQGQLPQPGRRRLPLGHHLAGVLVAQLVERKRAARRHRQRLGQQLGRITPAQRQARTQVLLGVGLQRQPAGAQRLADARGGEHVLQRFARAHMHVHVAHGHQRHGGERAALAQLVQQHLVVEPAQLRHAQPAASDEMLQQPARHGVHLVLVTRAFGHGDHHTVGQRLGADGGQRQAVRALG